MGHSKNRGRRGLTLPLQLRAKMIGLAMFIGGFMGLITSAQLDPISARVERVIDGDTIQVRFEGKSYTVRLRYVLLDGDNFNARLIRDGYAHAYRRLPSRSGRSLFNWKNKLGDGGSAYGTATEIARFRMSKLSKLDRAKAFSFPRSSTGTASIEWLLVVPFRSQRPAVGGVPGQLSRQNASLAFSVCHSRCLIWSSRQQAGRAILTISALPNLPVLDPRKLTDRRLDHCRAIFDDLKDREFLPANEAWRDETRKALDRELLFGITSVLQLDLGLEKGLDLLRKQWCAEPSVHGGKGTRIDAP